MHFHYLPDMWVQENPRKYKPTLNSRILHGF